MHPAWQAFMVTGPLSAELNPNYRRAYRNRARVYLLLKKHELALQDEKKAEKLAKASR